MSTPPTKNRWLSNGPPSLNSNSFFSSGCFCIYITEFMCIILYALRTLRAHGMRQDCLHEASVPRFFAKLLLYMQAQLGQVSVLQAKSTNSTDSSTDAHLSTNAARRLHTLLNYLMWQINLFKTVLSNSHHV